MNHLQRWEEIGPLGRKGVKKKKKKEKRKKKKKNVGKEKRKRFLWESEEFSNKKINCCYLLV